jgi:ABC-type uncharacterized transport system ATPase subunit
MFDLVNRLHSTGFDKSITFHVIPCLDDLPTSVQIDIDLPQIVVIGAQSAGKSSLIDSISGITVPRTAGTCTRYIYISSLPVN